MNEKSYDHLAALVQQENADFEGFYAHMQTVIPALKGRGRIEVPPAGFKSALKTAYVAGADDTLKKIIQPDT